MTDLEMTRLCAEAVGIDGWLTADDPMVTNDHGEFVCPYDPLHDDAQAMELVKRLNLSIRMANDGWRVWPQYEPEHTQMHGCNENLNRAIVECVANMQLAKLNIKCPIQHAENTTESGKSGG